MQLTTPIIVDTTEESAQRTAIKIVRLLLLLRTPIIRTMKQLTER